MDSLTQAFNWAIANKGQVLTILTSIITVASVVAKLTPTETDNRILGKILKIVDMLAVNNKPTEIKWTAKK